MIVGFGNGRVQTLGTTQITLKIDNVVGQLKAHVVPDVTQDIPVLVGRTFTELPHIMCLKDKDQFKFLEDHLPIHAIPEDARKVSLWARKTIIIPPNHIGNIPVDTKDSYQGDLYVDSSLRFEEGKECCIPRTILNIKIGSESYLPMVNLSDQDLEVRMGKRVARGWPCIPETAPNQTVLNLNSKPLRELDLTQITVGPIGKDYLNKLCDLIKEYRACFSVGLEDLGCVTTGDKIKITLTDNKPFTYRPYRMAESEKEKVRGIVSELLENGIIRESSSSYSSPLLLVKKKDGTDRMCIDFRKLNSLTVREIYPMPRVDERLEKLHGCKYFTSLDLRAGYHQIPVDEDSKHLTAFMTSEGSYEFNRMPFGLTNAPAVFQRLMRKILLPAKGIVEVFLDDMLLPSETVEQGLENLRTVFQILNQAGLTLNLGKCAFLMSNVTYLGFQISSQGLQDQLQVNLERMRSELGGKRSKRLLKRLNKPWLPDQFWRCIIRTQATASVTCRS